METRDPDRTEALRRERIRQQRGLLLIAAVVFLFILWRARPLHLFAANWWRL